jgi:hypothetical protein
MRNLHHALIVLALATLPVIAVQCGFGTSPSDPPPTSPSIP